MVVYCKVQQLPQSKQNKLQRQENRFNGKLTFTALAVSSVNGGTTPDKIAVNERPNSRQVARTIDCFAPRDQLYI